VVLRGGVRLLSRQKAKTKRQKAKGKRQRFRSRRAWYARPHIAASWHLHLRTQEATCALRMAMGLRPVF